MEKESLSFYVLYKNGLYYSGVNNQLRLTWTPELALALHFTERKAIDILNSSPINQTFEGAKAVKMTFSPSQKE